MPKIKNPKIFTLEEARRSLLFVKKIVADIVHCHQEKINLEKTIPQTKDLKERRQKISRLAQCKQQIEDCKQELNLVGCHLKNLTSGIVGFYWDPGNGSVGELYWKYGQDDIYYWQEIGHARLIPLNKFSSYRKQSKLLDP